MSRFRKHVMQNQTSTKGEKVSLAMLKQARTTGQLNLSNRSLEIVPDKVWDLNKPPSDGDNDFNSGGDERWWDQVELTKLILASNSLSSLSEKLSVFPALVVLDLHDNKLKELPNALQDLTKLEKLDLSHNELTCVPGSLTTIDSLIVLQLQHNQLAELSDQFGNLNQLQNLDLSHNHLQTLPDCWSGMTKLQKLNLSYNKLNGIPHEFSSLRSLAYLDLNSNSLSNLPQDLGRLQELQQLHLRNNALEEIPRLSDCGRLKELYCANNKLKTFEVSNVPKSLVIVELRENNIDAIKKDITEMTSLQRLDLANNNISSLPPEMGIMEQMKVLNVDGNPLRSIRRDIIAKGTQALLKYLRTRIVQHDNEEQKDKVLNTTQALPASKTMSEITEKHALSKSKSLDLSKTPWSENSQRALDDNSDIPMETINISKVGMSKFPNHLCQFQGSLRNLNLSVNKLTILPPEIGSFTSLTHLDLSTNNLSDLPNEMAALIGLVELNIVQNRLTDIPECVFGMTKLEHLLAGGNQISKINVSGLLKLSVLATLALQNNNISQIPPELGRLPAVKTLQLEGNLFRIPRHNIIQQGTVAIMDYLRNRLPAP